MNRKLLSLAVATAMAMPLAVMAAGPQVNVYGVGHLSLNYVNNNDKTPGHVSDTATLTSNQSNLGVYAREDLDGGWDAFGRVEGGINLNEGRIFGSSFATSTFGALGRNAIYVAAWQKLSGHNELKLALGRLDNLGEGGSGTSARWFAVGPSHNFSTATQIYVLYAMMSNGKNAQYGLGQFQGEGQYYVGYYMGYNDKGAVRGVPGENVQAVSIELKMAFGDDDHRWI